MKRSTTEIYFLVFSLSFNNILLTWRRFWKKYFKLFLLFIDLTFNESQIFHDFTFSKFFFPTRFWTFKGDCVVVYQWTFIPFSPCLSCLRPDCNWMVQSFHFHKKPIFRQFSTKQRRESPLWFDTNQPNIKDFSPVASVSNFGEKKRSCHNKTLSSECLCLMSARSSY